MPIAGSYFGSSSSDPSRPRDPAGTRRGERPDSRRRRVTWIEQLPARDRAACEGGLRRCSIARDTLARRTTALRCRWDRHDRIKARGDESPRSNACKTLHERLSGQCIPSGVPGRGREPILSGFGGKKCGASFLPQGRRRDGGLFRDRCKIRAVTKKAALIISGVGTRAPAEIGPRPRLVTTSAAARTELHALRAGCEPERASLETRMRRHGTQRFFPNGSPRRGVRCGGEGTGGRGR